MTGVLWAIVSRDVRRCAGALLLVSLAGVALGLLYPVQRELDIAAVSRSTVLTQAEIMVGPADLARVRADFGDNAFLTALWNSPVLSAEREANVLLMVTGTPDALDASPFPGATRSAGPAAVEGMSWVDLDVALARYLAVGPGDEVVLPVGPSGPRVSLTVRSLHAVRLPIAEYTALAPAAAVFPAVPGTEEERFFQLRTPSMDEAAIRAVLGQPFYRDRLAAAKLDPPVVTGRADLLATVADASASSLGLVRVTAVLAALGALAFAMREVDVLRRRSESHLALLTRLGASSGASLARVWVLAALPMTTAVLVGGSLGVGALNGGLLAPVLPPPLRVSLAITVACALGVTLAFLGLGNWRTARRVACG